MKPCSLSLISLFKYSSLDQLNCCLKIVGKFYNNHYNVLHVNYYTKLELWEYLKCVCICVYLYLCVCVCKYLQCEAGPWLSLLVDGGLTGETGVSVDRNQSVTEHTANHLTTQS